MSTSARTDPLVRGAGATLALMPVGVLVLLATLVLHAWLRTGEWPHPRSGNPFDGSEVASSIDPKELGAHYSVVVMAVLGMVVFAPIALGWLLVTAWKRSWRPHPAYLALYVLGVTTWFMMTALDLGGVLRWMVD